MIDRQFFVPDEIEIIETFGQESEPVGEEILTRRLHFTASGNNSLAFTYNILTQTIHCLWRRNNQVIVDICRSGATRWEIINKPETTSLVVTLTSAGLTEEIIIHIHPEFDIRSRTSSVPELLAPAPATLKPSLVKTGF